MEDKPFTSHLNALAPAKGAMLGCAFTLATACVVTLLVLALLSYMGGGRF
jgi:hypothetical protein